MGREVGECKFTELEFSEFRRLLRKETAMLSSWFEQGSLCNEPRKTIGLELEAWLVNEDYIPAPENKRFLENLDHPLVVPELSQFNTEINAEPADLEGQCFSKLHGNLQAVWDQAQKCAQGIGLKKVMIGSIPTLRDEMLSLEYMTDMKRYSAINSQFMHMRKGKPVHLKINGVEEVDVYHNDLMLEAATTSLQVHLKTSQDEAVRFFNASAVAAAFMVAACANTPFFYGRQLWQETRIPIFEQALDLPGFQNVNNTMIRRVSFGSNFVRESLLECFLENLHGFPCILPIVYDESTEYMNHLRLHNGTIWRWNRPILGLSDKGKPHVRMEHRVAAAGPTVVDTIANIALFVGLVHYFASLEIPLEQSISYEQARENFYAAAKEGLGAKVWWQDNKQHDLGNLLYNEILPNAIEALRQQDIDHQDISFYFNEVIAERLRTGQTGAQWQQSFIDTHGPDFQSLTQVYFENQERGDPVAAWTI